MPKYLFDGSFGIDRLLISVPIDAELFGTESLSRLLGGSKSNGIANIPDFPQITVRWNYSTYGLNIEFNPSAFSRPVGFEICPISLVWNICHLVICKVFDTAEPGSKPLYMYNRETGETFEKPPLDWPDQVLLYSVDLARDFNVEDPKFSLTQLTPYNPKNFTDTVLYFNNGQPNTLTHVSSKKAQTHKIYNKSAERNSRKRMKANQLPDLPSGVFRYEIRLKSRNLKEENVRVLSDLSDLKVLNLGRRFWEKSNYGSPLVWEGQFLEDLQSWDITESHAYEIYGYLVNKKYAIDFLPDSYVANKVLRTLKSHRVSAESIDDVRSKPYGALNFELGTIQKF